MTDKIQQAKELLEKEGYKIIAKNEISEDGLLEIPELSTEEYTFKLEINVHDKNKSWDELGLSEREDELLTAEQVLFLMNSKYAKELKMDGSSSNDDFFIKQYSDLSKANGYVAYFFADSWCSYLGSYEYSGVAYSDRGVRFVKKVPKNRIKGKVVNKLK